MDHFGVFLFKMSWSSSLIFQCLCSYLNPPFYVSVWFPTNSIPGQHCFQNKSGHVAPDFECTIFFSVACIPNCSFWNMSSFISVSTNSQECLVHNRCSMNTCYMNNFLISLTYKLSYKVIFINLISIFWHVSLCVCVCLCVCICIQRQRGTLYAGTHRGLKLSWHHIISWLFFTLIIDGEYLVT